MPEWTEEPFACLVGRTLTKIENNQNEELIFTCTDGAQYKMFHHQDCCESVNIEDICGDLNDLIGKPIVRAEESTSDNFHGEQRNPYESETWTFYIIGTAHNTVTIRWYGTSNGYYSECVNFERIDDNPE